MVVRLVARINVDDLKPEVIYPRGEKQDERIAKLTGIIQLVSVALERSDVSDEKKGTPMYMKSDSGVVGYCQLDDHILICEGDAERETADALRVIIDRSNSSLQELSEKVQGAVEKRGKEIGDLWR